jgi:hypothetical protein
MNNSAIDASVLSVHHVRIAEEGLAGGAQPAAILVEDSPCWMWDDWEMLPPRANHVAGVKAAGGAVSEGDSMEDEADEEQARLVPDTRWEGGTEEREGKKKKGANRQFTLCCCCCAPTVSIGRESNHAYSNL